MAEPPAPSAELEGGSGGGSGASRSTGPASGPADSAGAGPDGGGEVGAGTGAGAGAGAGAASPVANLARAASNDTIGSLGSEAVPTVQLETEAHQDWCQACLDGGRLTVCDTCLLSFHEDCYPAGSVGKSGTTCPQHSCWACPPDTAPGRLLACASCPRAFCEIHRPSTAVDVPQRKLRLSFVPSQTSYIHCCAACRSVSRGVRHGNLFSRGCRAAAPTAAWWLDRAAVLKAKKKGPWLRERGVLGSGLRAALFRLDPSMAVGAPAAAAPKPGEQGQAGKTKRTAEVGMGDVEEQPRKRRREA